MKKRKYQARNNVAKPRHMSLITLGKPEPILTTGTNYTDVWYDNEAQHWTLPIERLALAQLVNLSAQHGGVLYARRNMITADYKNGGLTHEQLGAAIFDWLTFGDVALLKVRNGWGDVIDLYPLPALYTRQRKTGEFVVLQQGEPMIYPPEDIVFLKQYDPQQAIYGLPDYISGIHSALLNGEATIFRRRYYHNGAHTGGLLYSTDPNMTDEVEEAIIQKLEHSKGIGNFSTMFVNIPKGDPDGIKFIPIGDISAKDEFQNVKSISAQDVLTAHRFPAGLAGIIPTNGAVMGDIEKAAKTYKKAEILPIQRMFAAAVAKQQDIPAYLHLNFMADHEQEGD
ncbi:phage portal protein [Pectobacterium sp. IFB5596]|uniref:phage portal protein n=1 Tax=Pectobacterium sp. IFB5596 TaxID=1839803 RepID=UPI001F21C97F|nr:phage portal protein [Pectobacterium sp. IFB5596]MCE9729770.1 phage portal protein [Pectobacterium sp. IFB5596]GKW11674.1 phage portal protein [Pectobacterium carotovorum subsp. carotovorum]